MSGNARDDRPDGTPQPIDTASVARSQMSFQLGEDLFDGVEVGAVDGQQPYGGAGCFDCLPNTGNCVCIHNNDVARRRTGTSIYST